MASEIGYNYRVFLSSDGTSGGTKEELECQSDLTINTGKATNTTVYKNCTHTSFSRSGFTAETQFGEEAPIGTAQALAWSAHENETSWYCWFESTTSGGQSFAGMMKMAISSISAPVDGDTMHSITFGADGPVTRGVVA